VALAYDVYIFDGDYGNPSENPNEGTDTIQTPTGFFTLPANFENLAYIGTGNFTGNGNALNNQIVGGSGNDTLFGDVGDNTISGGAGNDSLIALAGNNSFSGGSGQDSIQKNGGSDIADGGDGNDVFFNVSATGLVNGVYPDPSTFTGGAGTDTFRLGINFAGTVIRDVVSDFQTGPGGDIIGLATAGLISFSSSKDPFANGYYRLVQDNADTVLQADRDGVQSNFDWVTVLLLKNTAATSFTAFNFEAPLDFNPNGPTAVNLTG
jgi:Ca2+-binding RTX toxin-like protein